MEGQRERARGHLLGDRAQPLGEPVPLAHVRLQVDARQVTGGLDAVLGEPADDLLAVGSGRQRDDVDEPRPLVLVVVGARQLEPGDVTEQLRVAAGDLTPRGEDRVELLELPEPDRGLDVREPVVEAEPRVVEPAAGIRAALVAQAPRAGATRPRSAS